MWKESEWSLFKKKSTIYCLQHIYYFHISRSKLSVCSENIFLAFLSHENATMMMMTYVYDIHTFAVASARWENVRAAWLETWAAHWGVCANGISCFRVYIFPPNEKCFIFFSFGLRKDRCWNIWMKLCFRTRNSRNALTEKPNSLSSLSGLEICPASVFDIRRIFRNIIYFFRLFHSFDVVFLWERKWEN